jgi:hypothetical protein
VLGNVFCALMFMALMQPAWAQQPNDPVRPETQVKPITACDRYYHKYLVKLKKQIQSKWQPELIQKKCEITIQFSIDRQGNITGIPSFMTKSSRSVENDLALDAIKAAAPFAPLPACHGDNDLKVQFTFDYSQYPDTVEPDFKAGQLPTASLSGAPKIIIPNTPYEKLPPLTPITPTLNEYRNGIIQRLTNRWEPNSSDWGKHGRLRLTVNQQGRVVNKYLLIEDSVEKMTYTLTDALTLESPFLPLPQTMNEATFEFNYAVIPKQKKIW